MRLWEDGLTLDFISQAILPKANRLALEKDAPEARGIQEPSIGGVIEIAEVGGLHHRSERRAA